MSERTYNRFMTVASVVIFGGLALAIFGSIVNLLVG